MMPSDFNQYRYPFHWLSSVWEQIYRETVMKCFQWTKFNNHGEQSEECEEDMGWIQVMGCHPLGVQENVALIIETETRCWPYCKWRSGSHLGWTWKMFYAVILCIQVQYYQRSLLYQSLLSFAVLEGTISDKHRQALL
jgi:hypothetical protein